MTNEEKAKVAADKSVEAMRTADSSEAYLRALVAATRDPAATKFEDDLTSQVESIQDKAINSKPLQSNGIHDTVHDSYENNLLNISTNENGASKSSSMFDQYSLSNDTLNWALWIALYNDSWVFKKAIDKPAEDEINCGISLHNSIDLTAVYDEYTTLKPNMIQLLKWGALFGGSVSFMMFDGLKDEDYAKPIDYNKIAPDAKMRMYVTDRWYGCAQDGIKTVSRMKDPDFGKPVYYSIMFANGKMLKVHHSYILRYEHRDAPNFMKFGMLQGWGYAEGCHILNELTQNDKLKTSIQSLVDKALIEVIHMPGMRAIFMGTDKSNEEQLKKRLEMVIWARNYNSLTFLDKDDQYEKNEFGGLSGLADLLEQNRWQIASALDMNGILYGDMKNGMGSDTQAIPSYNKTILGRCEAWVRPVMYKLLKVLFRKHEIKEQPNFIFNATYKDIEDTAKIDMLSKYSGMLRSLMSDGIITKEQYTESFQNYMNNGAISIAFTKAEKAIASTDKGGNNSSESDIDTDLLNESEEAGITTPSNIEPQHHTTEQHTNQETKPAETTTAPQQTQTTQENVTATTQQALKEANR